MRVSVWRGAQAAPLPPLSSIESLLAKNANLIRYQITASTNDLNNWNAAQWAAFVRTNLDHLDDLLPYIVGNARVVLDIHSPPGGFVGNKAVMFQDGHWGKAALLSMWQEIAFRYKHIPTVYVYGVLNEPAGGVMKVNELMQEAVDKIREVDLLKRIAVTSAYSDPLKFDKVLPITPKKNIWYEAHMYLPLALTHQGIYDYPTPKEYPTETLDIKKLRVYLKKIRDFQKANKVRVYIGEFSISSFAPVATRINYLSDLITIFEKRRWAWTYHAWREANVWNAELTPEVADLLYVQWAKNTRV